MKRLCKFRPSLIMRAFIIVIAAMGAALQASAQDQMMCLVVSLKSGSTEKFVLAEKPSLTFSDTECTFNVSGYEVKHALADIYKAYFAMGTSSVDEVAAETVSIDFTTPEQLIVHGVAPGTPVTIYDTAGRMLTAAKAGDDHTASLCIGALPKSTIYIVSVSNTKNFKFIKQ